MIPAGTHFITADQPGEVVYVILEGTVKIYVTREDGREVILAFLGRGDTVGEMSLIDSAGRSANVVTTERSRLLWMDRATFQTCLRTLTPLANNLVRLLVEPAALRQRADPGAVHPGRARPGGPPDPRPGRPLWQPRRPAAR